MPVDLEQLRATRAFAAAAAAVRVQGAADFLGAARRLPEMLRTNGLLAAWAYLLAKENGKPGRLELRKSLAEHLGDRFSGPAAALGSLFEGTPPAVSLSALDLQWLTGEAVVFAGWLKRAGEALCDLGDDGGEAGVPKAGEVA